MAQDQTDRSDRRAFLQAGALATASALSAAPGYGAQAAPAKAATLPKRKLGTTGLEITMLEMGTGALREQGVLERLIRLSYASGVRTFDTAKAYGTEPGFKKWLERTPEVRKEIVLVTKDNPREPKEMLAMLDKRLAALSTDYIDVFMVHGMGDDHKRLDDAINFVKSQEFKRTADAMRKSGKAKIHLAFPPTTKTGPPSFRRRPRPASSTRLCFSTRPGSIRTSRSTRPSTHATRKASA